LFLAVSHYGVGVVAAPAYEGLNVWQKRPLSPNFTL